MKVWRPSKYDPKYCDEIIRFMSGTQHEIVVDRTFYTSKDEIEPDVDWFRRANVKKEEHKVFAQVFPTLERFCHNIGVHKDTLHEWCSIYPEFSEAYKKARQIQESILVENALNNNYSANFSMFLAKNAFWWKDKTEVDQNIKAEINNTSNLSTDELLKLANASN